MTQTNTLFTMKQHPKGLMRSVRDWMDVLGIPHAGTDGNTHSPRTESNAGSRRSMRQHRNATAPRSHLGACAARANSAPSGGHAFASGEQSQTAPHQGLVPVPDAARWSRERHYSTHAGRFSGAQHRPQRASCPVRLRTTPYSARTSSDIRTSSATEPASDLRITFAR